MFVDSFYKIKVPHSNAIIEFASDYTSVMTGDLCGLRTRKELPNIKLVSFAILCTFAHRQQAESCPITLKFS